MSQSKIIELRNKAAQAMRDSTDLTRPDQERRLDEHAARSYQTMADNLEFSERLAVLPESTEPGTPAE